MPPCAALGVPEGTLIQAEFVYDWLFASAGAWEERGAWTARLDSALNAASPRLVAVIVPPDAGNRLHLFFALPGEATESCIAFTLALMPALPILSFHPLDTCQDMFAEVRRYQDLHDGTMMFRALDPALRE